MKRRLVLIVLVGVMVLGLAGYGTYRGFLGDAADEPGITEGYPAYDGAGETEAITEGMPAPGSEGVDEMPVPGLEGIEETIVEQ
jgi:hypothetical protein